jgi:hypothetical protein
MNAPDKNQVVQSLNKVVIAKFVFEKRPDDTKAAIMTLASFLESCGLSGEVTIVEREGSWEVWILSAAIAAFVGATAGEAAKDVYKVAKDICKVIANKVLGQKAEEDTEKMKALLRAQSRELVLSPRNAHEDVIENFINRGRGLFDSHPDLRKVVFGEIDFKEDAARFVVCTRDEAQPSFRAMQFKNISHERRFIELLNEEL